MLYDSSFNQFHFLGSCKLGFVKVFVQLADILLACDYEFRSLIALILDNPGWEIIFQERSTAIIFLKIWAV